MRFLNCLKNKRAQIVLPAILLIPTILLVIYLLFETAKLSRFKIRSQFALDSAAFIELTSYSNFLNAVAYTNGAFPFRVFRENMMEKIEKEEGVEGGEEDAPSITYYDLFYQAGAFPAMAEGNINSNPKDNAGKWELKFKEVSAEGEDNIPNGEGRPKNWNTENPKVEDGLAYGVNVKRLVEHYKYVYRPDEDNTNQAENSVNQNNNQEEDDKGIFAPVTLYIAAYKMFENIYESQKKVYERLTEGGEFFRKSFYYNSSSCKLSQCGKEGVRALKDYDLNLESVRLENMNWWWRLENDSESNALTFKSSEEKYKKFMPL